MKQKSGKISNPLSVLSPKARSQKPSTIPGQSRLATQEGVAVTPLIDIAEVARLLAVSKVTIRRKVNLGELPCVRLTKGGPMRFDLRDIEKFIEQHKG